MAWDFDGPPMHGPGAGRYYQEHYPEGMVNSQGDIMPFVGEYLRGESPTQTLIPRPTPDTSAPVVAPGSPSAVVVADSADALSEAQARLGEMEHRAASAEAETQRYIAAYQRLAERHQQVPLPREWCVESAQGEKRLAVLLNTLAQAGWMVDQIFEPRGGAYGVVAWREGVAHATTAE